MELSEKQVKRYREILLETLKAFKRTCEDNGLRWYMAFGSAIGTVRHKGFIPWDDDVDVFMPREDYERLLGVKVHGYSLVGPRVSLGMEDYPFPYTKFCDMNSTIWERRLYPCVFGVFIDVFPMDEAGEDAEAFRLAYRKAFEKYKRAQRVYDPSDFRGCLRMVDFPGAAKIWLDEVWYAGRIERYRDTYLAFEQRAAGMKGDSYIVHGTSDDYRNLTLPKSMFKDTVMMPFEDMEVPMPSGYDEMLKLFYGDYMKLPPRERQISNHYHWFIDLEKGMTLPEVVDTMVSSETD